jgi:hypothetical protein
MMNKILNKIYTNPKEPGSYSGFSGFSKALKTKNLNISRSDIKKYLQTQDAYTLHKPKRIHFKRKRVLVSGIDSCWQLDLADMSSLKASNKGYTFILTAIDVFSKKAQAIKLKNKNQINVTKAFARMIKKHKPLKIQVDNGKEFYNGYFEKLLKENGIEMYSTDSDVKASIIERFNRTLKEKMWRYFTDKSTNKWIDILDDLIASYNSAHHSSIKIEPNNVTKLNEDKIFENLYGYNRLEGDSSSFLNKFKFAPNDFVRISKIKKTFEKGYTRNFTREIFKIKSIKAKNPVSYNLVDLKGEKLIGSFYEEELQKVDYKGKLFFIDKIIKKKLLKIKSFILLAGKIIQAILIVGLAKKD